MKNVKTIKITVDGESWQNCLDKAYDKKKKDIKVDGFRKGAVPKDIYIKKVGVEALFMDACDIAINERYESTLKEANVTLACEPTVNIESVDKDSCVIEFTFISKPEVTLGAYTKLGVKREEVKVTKEEIEHEINHIKEHMAEVVIKENGNIEEGNTAVIDFEGFVDGKKLDGGTGANYPLEIGSNTFIPGFESGLIGASVGETRELNLKFPENYTEELKNKDVLFKVTVREIKERVMPEINKDFFEDLGIDGVDSIEKLEEHVKKDLEEHKKHEADDKYVDELLHIATDNMKVEINNEIIDSEIERMVNQYRQELQMQGVSLEQYLSMTNTKLEDMKSMMKPQAIARIKTRYLLEAIIDEKKLVATKEEIEKEIKDSCDKYGIEKDEFLRYVGGEEGIKYELEMRKAIDIIKEG
jgi:trigger factor